MAELMRLQKYLARAGIASRRASERLISEGHVSVDGRLVCELGTQVDPACCEVSVDGVAVRLPEAARYIMLNKPGGYLTTMSDPQGRPTVATLIPRDIPGLFPVGRLDCDTTGLLLFMTDGHLAAELLHPRYHVEKSYEVVVDGRVAEVEADVLRQGITLDDGPCKPARIDIVKSGPASELVCTISEGRKRQVKRMMAYIGHPVLYLHRASFGPLTLGDLELGKWRELSDNEIKELKKAVTREEEG